MLFTELLKMAWRSLAANKLRTFLTMLGELFLRKNFTRLDEICESAFNIAFKEISVCYSQNY